MAVSAVDVRRGWMGGGRKVYGKEEVAEGKVRGGEDGK